MSIAPRSLFHYALTTVLLVAARLPAQEAEAPNAPAEAPNVPEIADEPKTIDPATLVPEPLAVSATVDFTDSSLREVLQWLRDEQQLVVLVDNNALGEIGVSPSEPISDQLADQPLYLMLNRLRSLDLAWRYADDILHVTTEELAEEQLTTLPYNIGDLLDAQYDTDTLAEVIESTIRPESWDSVGGVAVLTFLGDVMFVRQTDDVQREVQGLLAALRQHGRRTFVLDPPQHADLRAGLQSDVTVEFVDTPLVDAIAQLAEQAEIDIRLDSVALRANRVREREPVTLRLTDRTLQTVLQAMLLELDLTWILRDGVLWITSRESAESFLKTAVFDVRDLCRDDDESDALAEALTSQTSAETWSEVGGPGEISFAQPGTLVVLNTEEVLTEVLDLLETYRTALRNSKPRDRTDEANEVTTVYYRMHSNVAEDLELVLPALVQPNSWHSEAFPDAKGQILRVSSTPELANAAAQPAKESAASDTKQPESLVVDRAVLIIRQTGKAHEEIRSVIRRVESGDSFGGGMGGGMGGGGFGGGFYSLPPAHDRTRK